MGNLLAESFATNPGYDNAGWTEVVGAGSTVDEDSTDIADSIGGANQVLKIAKVSPNFNAMTRHEISSSPIVYLTGWVYIASYTLPSAGNNVNLFTLLDSGGVYLMALTLRKTNDAGNPVKLRAYLHGTEIGNYPAAGSISTGQYYKVGLKYDKTNLAYNYSINDGSVVSGAIGAPGYEITRLKVGCNDNGMAFVGYFHNVFLHDSGYFPFAYTPKVRMVI